MNLILCASAPSNKPLHQMLIIKTLFSDNALQAFIGSMDSQAVCMFAISYYIVGRIKGAQMVIAFWAATENHTFNSASAANGSKTDSTSSMFTSSRAAGLHFGFCK